MFFGRERGHQLSMYAAVGAMGKEEGEGGSSKMRTAAYRGKRCHVSSVHTHLHSFHIFGSIFFLIVYCLICRNSTLILCKKHVFVRSGYFYPRKSISVVMK